MLPWRVAKRCALSKRYENLLQAPARFARLPFETAHHHQIDEEQHCRGNEHERVKLPAVERAHDDSDSSNSDDAAPDDDERDDYRMQGHRHIYARAQRRGRQLPVDLRQERVAIMYDAVDPETIVSDSAFKLLVVCREGEAKNSLRLDVRGEDADRFIERQPRLDGEAFVRDEGQALFNLPLSG